LSQRVLRDDFDADAVEAGIADRLEAGVSPQHLDRLAAFARTETGQLVTRIVQTRGAASLTREIDRHPPHLMRGLGMLFQSDAWKAAFEQIKGDVVGPMLLGYTKRLVCEGARRDEPDLFARMVSSGRCTADGAAADQ
jgi:CheY-specific phosphatase CheX